MARSTDQIMSELDRFFNPSAKIIKKQKNLIPGQIESATDALEARKENEFRDITARANARGAVYGGLPIEEEARYTGEQFLPALAGVRQAGQEQTLSLAESLAGLRREQGLIGQQLRQGELDREAAERQARRSAAAAQQQSTSGLQGVLDQILNQQPQTRGTFTPKSDGGFAFANNKNKPISAAKYAELNKMDIRDLLYDMAQSGDTYAAQAYNDLRSGYNKGTEQLFKRKYPAIFWGT